MTTMEYVARFIEFARFSDDYVATDMAKVRRFENGLELSIRGKIVGLRLQDIDSIVRNNPNHRERDRGCTGYPSLRMLVRRGRISLLLVRGRGRRFLLHTSFRTRAKMEHLVKQGRRYVISARQPGHVRRDCP